MAVTPEALVAEVWIPGRRGSLAPELVAATRRAERIPWRLEASLEALLAELQRGRPVLVFQNLGIEAIPRWHYAVVVGVDPVRDEILLRSGTERLRRTPVAVFERTWSRSGRWAIVALRAHERPAKLEQARWFATLAELEQAGRPALAFEAWSDWLADHPHDAGARFGRASAAAQLGELAAAARDYERLLGEQGEDVRVLNNLAEVRSRQGCRAEALTLVDRAAALAGPATAAVVEATRQAIAARAATTCAADPGFRTP